MGPSKSPPECFKDGEKFPSKCSSERNGPDRGAARHLLCQIEAQKSLGGGGPETLSHRSARVYVPF